MARVKETYKAKSERRTTHSSTKKMTERFRIMYDIDPDKAIVGARCAAECIFSELPKQNEN